MPELTTALDIRKDDLTAIAEARLREFALLRAGQEYAGACYLGGYAVETLLKAAICKALDLEGLPALFKVHNLEVLLFYSGLKRQLDRDVDVKQSFSRLLSAQTESMRYRKPGTVTAKQCDNMDLWLNHRTRGVVTWLRKRT